MAKQQVNKIHILYMILHPECKNNILKSLVMMVKYNL